MHVKNKIKLVLNDSYLKFIFLKPELGWR